MFQLVVKAVISAILVIAVSEFAKRGLAFGARVASLPLVSVLGLIWLWRDPQDASQMAARSEATFWCVLPGLPTFLAIPALLRAGAPLWIALTVGVALTAVLYLLKTAALIRFAIKLQGAPP